MQEKTRYSIIAEIAFFGGLYLALSLINPLDFGIFSFRPQNVLRAAYLFSPYPGIGVCIANYINSFVDGKLLIGLHPVIPLLNVVMGFICYYLAKRSHLIALLALVLSFSAVIALNYVVIGKLPFLVAFGSKLVTESITMIFGYFVFKKVYER